MLIKELNICIPFRYLFAFLLYSADKLLFPPPPDAVEDVPVREDPDVEVGGEDVVELPDLLVPEEGVRHPHLARVSQGQVADLVWEVRYKTSNYQS